MKKFKAFTLIEMMITLSLTAGALILAQSVYGIFRSFQLSYQRQVDQTYHAALLQDRMRRDLDQSWGIVCLSPTSLEFQDRLRQPLVQYYLTQNHIIRLSLKMDDIPPDTLAFAGIWQLSLDGQSIKLVDTLNQLNYHFSLPQRSQAKATDFQACNPGY